MDERACQYCGGPLPTDAPQRLYCSHYCRSVFWRLSNLDRAAACLRAWNAKNRMRSREIARASAQRNREAKRERDRQWTAENRDKKAAQAARRRALESAALRSWSDAQWRTLLAEHQFRCGYCATESDLVPDHRIALSRGGENTIENIIPACPECNARKGVRDELEFRALLAYEAFVAGRRRSRSVEERAGAWRCEAAA